MFEYLSSAGLELHNELVKMYWVLLVPFIIFLLVMEIIKDENPNTKEIFRRIILSILLLITFDWAINSIAVLGDSITEKINGLEKLGDVLAKIGPTNSSQDSWFSLRETTIYIFSLASYIVAYLGFFIATALTHFVWTILYVCSPLMILAFISPHTSFVTTSLYKGLVQVVLWKILWSILGVLLLKLAEQPQVTGLEDYLTTIVVNLCIGVSMLFIPLATRSLISDGLNSVANTLAMAPAFAAAGAMKLTASTWASKMGVNAKGAAQFIAKPITNPIVGRYEQIKDRVKPRVDNFIQSYRSIGLPKKDNHNSQRSSFTNVRK